MNKISNFFARILLLLTCTVSNLLFAQAPPDFQLPDYFVDETKLPFAALPNAEAFWGIHTGAGYRIEVPDNWNGGLVMWAHGFRGTGLELRVSNPPPGLRMAAINNGYAWAASSYSRNDYDVATGAQDTHALIGKFRGLIGNPNRIYMTGLSMGGHITAVSVEQYRNTYDGALAACGVMADYELFDYFIDFNLAAQQIGTGSSVFPVDPFEYIVFTVPAIKQALEAFPGSWPFLLNPQGENFKNLAELRSGGVRPNFDEAFIFWNVIPSGSGPGNFLFGLGGTDGLIARTPGIAVDNAFVTYQFDTDPALTPAEQALNDSIFRVAYDPQGRHPNGLAQLPPVSGNLPVPVLTMHNLGDLFVPVHNEVIYAERVEAQGKSDLLVQRAIRGVNHCGFTPDEWGTSFLDLVDWVENENKPSGDDFSNPAAVAAPDFGCNFTDFATPGGHISATPCP